MTYREQSVIPPPCPRCGAGLFTGKVGHLDALGCGGCGGLWLDNAGTTAVLQRYDIDAEILARKVDGNAARREALSPFADTKGLCPVCGELLQAVQHQGVRLDYCAQHGTFFDRGELARVQEHVKPALTPAPAPLAGPSLADIRTMTRHEAARVNDPLGTALFDWATGGEGWVNRWRK